MSEIVESKTYEVQYKTILIPIRFILKRVDGFYGIFKVYMGDKWIGDYDGGFVEYLRYDMRPKISRSLNLLQEKASMLATPDLITFIKRNFNLDCKELKKNVCQSIPRGEYIE